MSYDDLYSLVDDLLKRREDHHRCSVDELIENIQLENLDVDAFLKKLEKQLDDNSLSQS
jgi:hypothetical protein